MLIHYSNTVLIGDGKGFIRSGPPIYRLDIDEQPNDQVGYWLNPAERKHDRSSLK